MTREAILVLLVLGCDLISSDCSTKVSIESTLTLETNNELRTCMMKLMKGAVTYIRLLILSRDQFLEIFTFSLTSYNHSASFICLKYKSDTFQ